MIPEKSPTRTNPEDYWDLWIKIRRKERLVSIFWFAIIVITLTALLLK